MKKVLFSTAAILALSLSAFAGTPEKAEAKPEAKTETSAGQLHWFKKTGPSTYVYQNSTLTKEEQQLNTGCGEPSGIECQRAFDDSQVNSSSNPSAILPGQENSPVEMIYSLD